MENTPSTPSGVAPQTAGGTAVGSTDVLKPDGPVAAVILATGIGTLVLGLLTTLGEASESIADFLKFSERVGPLSGKTILAVAAFLVSWAGLHAVMRKREVDLRPVTIAFLVMFVIALVLVFPPFFQLFESD